MTPPLRTRTAVLATLAALSLAVACGGTTTPEIGDAGNGPVGDGAIPDPGSPDSAISDSGTPGGRVPKEHRPSNDICSADQPTVTTGGGGNVACQPVHECTTDAECQDAGRQGKCGTFCGGKTCFYDTCQADSDCKLGTVCGCANGPGGTHACFSEGNCRVDADCGSHGYCSPSESTCGAYSGTTGFYCHSTSDECLDDSDCAGTAPTGLSQKPTCRYDMAAAHWKCSTAECAG